MKLKIQNEYLKGRKENLPIELYKKWACLNFENDDVRTDKS